MIKLLTEPERKLFTEVVNLQLQIYSKFDSPQRPNLRRAQLRLVVLRRQHIVGSGARLRIGRPNGNPTDGGVRFGRWRGRHQRTVKHHWNPALVRLLLMRMLKMVLMLLVGGIVRRCRRRGVVIDVVVSTFVVWMVLWVFFFQLFVRMSDKRNVGFFDRLLLFRIVSQKKYDNNENENMDKTNE